MPPVLIASAVLTSGILLLFSPNQIGMVVSNHILFFKDLDWLTSTADKLCERFLTLFV